MKFEAVNSGITGPDGFRTAGIACGIKASGLGYKEGVIETMKAMTNVKTYSLPWDAP